MYAEETHECGGVFKLAENDNQVPPSGTCVKGRRIHSKGNLIITTSLQLPIFQYIIGKISASLQAFVRRVR